MAGHLVAWRQGPDGMWSARVTLDVPQAAVRPREGQSYDQVPRERPYIVVVDTRRKMPAAEIHVAGCWSLGTPRPYQRVTPLPDAAMAATMLRFADTTACGACGAERLGGG